MKCSTTFSKCGTNHIEDPMFLSETGLDVSRTDSVKYPDILKMDEKMRSLFWVPEEVKISKDVTDFKSLPEHEQQIFTETLLRATMLDSIQGRSPSICLLPIVTNPEAELAISTWDFFETIHSKSYSYIIKNIYSNPSKVFDSLMGIKGITDCATSISFYYDNLVEMNAKMTLQTPDYDLFEHKKALYLCLEAINALESIRFYSAFAVFFNFGEQNRMQGSAKILQMIARDESIHVGLTTSFMNKLANEDSDYVKIKEKFSDELVKIYIDVIEQEIEWVKYILSKGSLLGLNVSILSDYIYYLGRQKMKQFGFSEEVMDFPVVRSNPLPWINRWLNTAALQVAPQESEQINYQAGKINLNDVDLGGMSL